MSVRTGYAFRCDRPDCGESLSVVCDASEVHAQLIAAGWAVSRRGRALMHLCAEHSQKHNTPPEGGVLRGIPNRTKGTGEMDRRKGEPLVDVRTPL